MSSFRTKMLFKGGEPRPWPQVMKWAQPEPTPNAPPAAERMLPELEHNVETVLDNSLPSRILSSSLQTDGSRYLEYSQFPSAQSAQRTQSTQNTVASLTLRESVRLLSQPSVELIPAHISPSTSVDVTASKTTSADVPGTFGTFAAQESSYLLSSDTARHTLTPRPTNANATATATVQSGPAPAHDTRKVVLACVLGGVLGLVGCAIIGFCLFNLSGWYKGYKKRRAQQILSPSLSPLEKMDSNDPLAHLENSIEVRRGSMIYISSPLAGDNILRLKGPPPTIPRRNPLRHTQSSKPSEPTYYEFHPRPEILEPRRAPPPPSMFPEGAPSLRASNATQKLGEESFEPEPSQEPQEPAEHCAEVSAGNAMGPRSRSGASSSSSTQIEMHHGAPNELSELHLDDKTPLAPLPCSTSSPRQSVLRTGNRISTSSSCYSAKMMPVTPRGDLHMTIDRTSSSSFTNAICPVSAAFGDSALPADDDKVVMAQDEEVHSMARRLDETRPASPSDESSPQVYDDGRGSYPELASEFYGDDMEETAGARRVSRALVTPDLDSVDFFA